MAIRQQSELIATAGLLALLLRNGRRLPNRRARVADHRAGVAWRSLQNYFSFAAVFALAGDEAVVAGDGDEAASQSMGAMSSGTTPDSACEF